MAQKKINNCTGDTFENINDTQNFFNEIFFNNPHKLTINNYASNSNITFTENEIPFSLNTNITINYTTKFNILQTKEFISASQTAINKKFTRKKLKNLSKKISK